MAKREGAMGRWCEAKVRGGAWGPRDGREDKRRERGGEKGCEDTRGGNPCLCKGGSKEWNRVFLSKGLGGP